MKRKYLILAALAVCLLPAVASAGRGYGYYGGGFGYGNGGYAFGANFGYGRYYDRPYYYRTRSYYVPVVTRYYAPCYDYAPAYCPPAPRVYTHARYYYERPSRPYYPRRYYRYSD